MAIAQLIDDCLENPPKERPTARQAHDIIKRCLTSLPRSQPQEVRTLLERLFSCRGCNTEQASQRPWRTYYAS